MLFRRHLVHRCVLYAASDYFKALFTTDMQERDAKEIVLKDVSGTILNQLIHFCYTLQISIAEDNVEAILAAANFYGINKLVTMCCEFYQNHLEISNALAYLTMAHAYDLVDFREQTEKFVFRRFLEILEDASFIRLTAENLLELLKRNEIAVKSEEDIFNAAVKWIDEDQDGRKQHFPMLMDALRMSQLDEKVFSPDCLILISVDSFIYPKYSSS